MAARRETAGGARTSPSVLALPSNDYVWSSWEDADAALCEIDGLISAVESGALPDRLDVSVLFAPTGPIQEVSLSSGWGLEFIELAARFDAVERKLYV